MIVSVSLENWMSFRDQTTFSMVATRERQHGGRVPKVQKYQARVLPIAALYGGNASGKSNFFRALSFVKNFIVDGTKPGGNIPVDRFLLDEESYSKPSQFQLMLLINEKLFEFSFAVTPKAVIEEKVVAITSTSEKVLYHRKNDEIKFDSSIASDDFLKFAFRGTRRNQLFLTNSVSQNVNNFRQIYDWFDDSLILIGSTSQYFALGGFLSEQDSHHLTMNQVLSQLDTGIDHVGAEEIPFDQIPIPESTKDKLMGEVKEGMNVELTHASTNSRFFVTHKDSDLIVWKPVAYHRKSDGTKAKFELWQESDGSQRLLDLLPAFLDLSSPGSKRVYLIDEIDRHLHTSLVRKLLENYLAMSDADTRMQLLFTTHDVMLMDQQLLRRDEMWVVERETSGASCLYSFSDFKGIRYDKDIRKSYLQGRLGGVPRLSLGENLASVGDNEDG